MISKEYLKKIIKKPSTIILIISILVAAFVVCKKIKKDFDRKNNERIYAPAQTQ